jgi:hypothetical protein
VVAFPVMRRPPLHVPSPFTRLESVIVFIASECLCTPPFDQDAISIRTFCGCGMLGKYFPFSTKHRVAICHVSDVRFVSNYGGTVIGYQCVTTTTTRHSAVAV